MKKAYLLFSVDFETLSLNVHNCPILSLGAYPFFFSVVGDVENSLSYELVNPFDELDSHFPEFHYYSVPNYSLQTNRIASEDTLKWWTEQSPLSAAVIKESLSSDILLEDTIHSFNNWIKRCCKSVKKKYISTNKEQEVEVLPIILGNGAAFDNAILDQICIEYNVKPNWSYKHSLCARTLFAIMGSDVKQYEELYITYTKLILGVNEVNKHNALFDAVYQAQKLGHIGLPLLRQLISNVSSY